jgi:hypothetical protein
MNGTVSSFRELHQRKKKEQLESKVSEITTFDKMLNSISHEIKNLEPYSILKTVNPEIEAVEEIEQIQNYCNLIEREITNIVTS